MINNKYFIILVAILGVAFYFGFLSTGSLLGLPVETKTYSFDGVDGVAESPTFATLENDRTTSFCGSNDRDVSISNGLTDGDSLILTSSMIAKKRACSQKNYIRTKLNLPAGKLTGVCTASAENPKMASEFAEAGCEVGNIKVLVTGKRYGGRDTVSKEFKIILETPQVVSVLVKSGIAWNYATDSSSSTKLTLNFEELTQEEIKEVVEEAEEIKEEIKEEQEQEPPECIQNIDCIKTCEDKKPTCYDGRCFCDDVKEEVIEGTTYIQELNIFQKFWAWLKELFR